MALNVLLACTLLYVLYAQKRGSRQNAADREYAQLDSSKALKARWKQLAKDAQEACLQRNHTKVEWNTKQGKRSKRDVHAIPRQACARDDLHSKEMCSLSSKAPKVLSQLMNGAVLEGNDRLSALGRHVKQGGRIVEVGTLHGYLRRYMLERLKPSLLVVMDIDPNAIRTCNKEHAALVAEGKVRCLLGESTQLLSELDVDSFDLIYIDANHNYNAVCHDIEAARDKVRPGGLMVMNDYYLFESLFLPNMGRWKVYGVIHATNEFLNRHGWKVVYMTLHERQEPDLAIRRPGLEPKVVTALAPPKA